MPDQGGPHVVLGIGHADLAQIARQGAQQRHLPPCQPGDEHQRVVAVVLGVGAHDGGEAVVEPPLGGFEIDRTVPDEFQQHVVQPELLRVRAAGLGVIGALVDDPEPHVLEHRHALRQRQRAAVAPQLEASRADIVVAGSALEVDAERGVGRHRLEGRDVLHRGRGSKGVAIGRRKCPAVTGEEIAGQDRIVDAGERLEQEIRPRLREARHFGFEPRAVRMGEFAVGARDDEMHADQRTFREVRHERRDLAVERGRQQPADGGTRSAAVRLARHVDQDGDEALEPVVARQHPHARPFAELQDDRREVEQRLLVDLEQLVARIGIQHVGERLAGMAVGAVSGAREDAGDLAAQVGNVAGRAGIGRRGEQADDLKSADGPAVVVVMLDPDEVHRHPPVHPRARVGLGDEEQPALVERRLCPRRHLDLAAVGGHHLAAVVAQDAERGTGDGVKDIPVPIQPIIADAEEGEIFVLQPFQEQDRLADLVVRQRRRIGLERFDDRGDAVDHGAPVFHRAADVGEHAGERGDQCALDRFVVDAVDVDLDHAFAQRTRRPTGIGENADEGAGGVALDREHRVDQQVGVEAPLGQLAHDGIDQERHVVIDELDDGNVPEPGTVFGRRRGDADLRGPRLALGEEVPGRRRDIRKLGRLVADEVLGGGPAE